MTAIQRARRIRQHYARLAAIEAEAKSIRTALLPLETEESWSLGYRFRLNGDKLLAAMDHRDGKREAAA